MVVTRMANQRKSEEELASIISTLQGIFDRPASLSVYLRIRQGRSSADAQTTVRWLRPWGGVKCIAFVLSQVVHDFPFCAALLQNKELDFYATYVMGKLNAAIEVATSEMQSAKGTHCMSVCICVCA